MRFRFVQLFFLAACFSAPAVSQSAPSVTHVDERGVTSTCSTAYFLVEFDQAVQGVDSSDLAFNPASFGGSVTQVGNLAVELNNGNERVSSDAFSGMPSTDITIETWLRTTDSGGTLFDYSPTGNSNSAIRLANPSSLTLHLFNTSVVSTATAIDDGQWHHVAASWSSATGDAAIVVDGVLAGSSNGFSGSTIVDGGRFAVSNRYVNGGFSGAVQGDFDEVRIWDHVRTPGVIQTERFTTLRGDEPGLALYWAMEALEDLQVLSTALDIRDLGPNGNHGHGAASPALISGGPPMDGSRWSVVVDVTGAAAGGFSVDVLDDGSITATNGGLPLTGPFSGGDVVVVSPNVLLTSVTPSGVVNYGDLITLNGSGFDAEILDVLIDGISANFTVVDDMTITATVPAQFCSSGLVDVMVVGQCTSSSLVNALSIDDRYSAFTYSPLWVRSSGGDILTVEGINLDTTVEVLIEGASTPFVVVDDETVAITMPALSGIAPVLVALFNGCESRLLFVAHGVPVSVPGDYATLEAAVTDPATGGGRIVLLGPGRFTPAPGSLTSVIQPVAIQGAGADRTVIDFGNASYFSGIFSFGTSLEDVTIDRAYNPSGPAWRSSRGMIRRCRFVGCHGDDETVSLLEALVEDCEFTANTAGDATLRAAFCRIDRSRITLNQSSVALSVDNCDLYNCLIAANSLGQEVVAFENSYMELTTIVDNLGAAEGIRSLNSGSGNTLIGCIVRNGLTNELDFATTPATAYCNIESGFPGTGNNDVDPMFADPSKLDYRPVLGAPGIDYVVGTPWGQDLMGQPRLLGGAVDQGCFEYDGVAHPGTAEDLEIRSNVSLALPVEGAIPVPGGRYVAFTFDSPAGSFTGTVPVVLGQIFLTGTPLVQPLPGLAVDPGVGGLFLLFDGNAPGPLGPAYLPPQGLNWSFVVPPGLGGFSTLIQGLVLSGQAANGIFAGTNGFEIMML